MITSLEADNEDEKCIDTVCNFVKNKMRMDVAEMDVQQAFHKGRNKGRKPRLMVDAPAG